MVLTCKMGTLSKKQIAHTSRKARLILYAESLGYAMKETYSLRCSDCKVGHPRSLHKEALASDFVIITGGIVDPVSEKKHAKLHDFWDMLGGSKRIKKDLGHYSTAYRGMR